MNGADILCDTLLANGVDVCFANPGTSEMHFVAALDRKPQMRCILGLFEGVVTGAADGYARMADKPAATLLHLGPGLANGLANLHNARRANTPVVNIVGDHATHHLKVDAPLTSDIESLARPMSKWVRTSRGADDLSADAAAAIAAAREGAAGVATLILPADAAWTPVTSGQVATARPRAAMPVGAARIGDAARLLRSGKKVLLLLGDSALRAAPLEAAAAIAEATGARLMAQQSNRRIERGAGRVALERVIYNIDAAAADLADIDAAILVGAREPAAFFAYPGKPARPLRPDCLVYELAEPGDALLAALQALAGELGCRTADAGRFHAPLRRPEFADGALDPRSLAGVVGAWLPEGAIVCDESLTAGAHLYAMTAGAPAHDYIQLTGGAIGGGLPMATGAAVACPDRRVVSIQADGSAMYTVQALWTQAREELDVVTVILANRSYAVLHHELKNVGATSAGRNAARMFDLQDPSLGWVQLANGMGVEATSVTDTAGLRAALAAAAARRGPFLIEAVI